MAAFKIDFPDALRWFVFSGKLKLYNTLAGRLDNILFTPNRFPKVVEAHLSFSFTEARQKYENPDSHSWATGRFLWLPGADAGLRFAAGSLVKRPTFRM